MGDGAASGLWLKDQGYESVAFLVQNEESTISPAQVARTTLEDAGIELTDFVVYNPGQPSYQAELISVLSHEPDAIYLAGGRNLALPLSKKQPLVVSKENGSLPPILRFRKSLTQPVLICLMVGLT